MRENLICTVGTSLLGHRRFNLDPKAGNNPTGGSTKPVVSELIKCDPNDRVCGAEINSVASICSSKKLDNCQRVFLLVSDTPEGQAIGKILRAYFTDSASPLQFEESHIVTLNGLSGDNPKVFRNLGLRSLVVEVAVLARKYHSETLAINATGGYKAQIAFAALLGQALEVPVYYLFEAFPYIIDLPPQPISMDLSLWLENYELLDQLSRDQAIVITAGLDSLDPKLASLLEQDIIDGTTYTALTPIGHLFHEGFRYRLAGLGKAVLPPPARRRKRPESNIHLMHAKADASTKFITKVYDETPYIRHAQSTWTNPDQPDRSRFHLVADGRGPHVELIWSDRNATAKWHLFIDSQETAQLRAAVADLNERYFTA